LDDFKQYYAKTVRPDLTTIVVIGDVTPEEAQSVVGKWFGGEWKTSGPKPDVTLPRVPLNAVSVVTVSDPSQPQNSVNLKARARRARQTNEVYAPRLIRQAG
jgi:zinc protease